MRKIRKGKFGFLELSLFSLMCYPLLKFNFSSLLFIIFCVVALVYEIREKKLVITKNKLRQFLAFTAYFFLLLISVIYAEDPKKGIDWIVRLLPLLLVPLVILFFNPSFPKASKIRALNIYLFCNVIFIVILGLVYLTAQGGANLNYYNSGSFLSYDKVQFVLNKVITGDLLFVHKAYFSMGFVLISVFCLQRANHFFGVKSRLSKLYFLFFLAFSLLVVYTFSFPNIIALIFCVPLFIIYEYRKGTLNIKKQLLPFAIILGLLISGVFLFSNDLDVARGMRFVNSVISQNNVEGNDPRIEIYKTYGNLFEKAGPTDILFGYGIGDEQKMLHRELEQRLWDSQNKNMLSFNEEFNSAYWFRNNVTVIPNQANAPKNIKIADLLIETTTTEVSSHNLSTNLNLEKDEVYTFSVYAKKGTASKLIMRLGPLENRAYFDLNEGKVARYEGVISANVDAIGEDWYRCYISVLGSDDPLVILGISDEAGTYNYIGSGKSLYLWGAQIERNKEVTSYIKNGKELMEYAYTENLNSHNNYLFFLLNGGLLCLGAFLLSLFLLFYIAFKNKNILQMVFCSIVALNFLTENILSRHWGLMFVAVIILLLFTPNSTETNAEKSV